MYKFSEIPDLKTDILWGGSLKVMYFHINQNDKKAVNHKVWKGQNIYFIGYLLIIHPS